VPHATGAVAAIKIDKLNLEYYSNEIADVEFCELNHSFICIKPGQIYAGGWEEGTA